MVEEDVVDESDVMIGRVVMLGGGAVLRRKSISDSSCVFVFGGGAVSSRSSSSLSLMAYGSRTRLRVRFGVPSPARADWRSVMLAGCFVGAAA